MEEKKEVSGVAARFRSYRLSEELTMEEMGERLGITRQAVSLIEAGKRGVGLDLALRFEDLTGVTPRELSEPDRREPVSA